MREISCKEISGAIDKLCIDAACVLPPALGILLECAYEGEPSETVAAELSDIVDSFKNAAFTTQPICREDYSVTVYADIGCDVRIMEGTLEEAVSAGMRRGYKSGLLGTDCKYVLHKHLTEGNGLTLKVVPICNKCADLGATRVFTRTEPIDTAVVEDFAVETVLKTRDALCPPVVVGIGLDETAEQAALTAEKALLRPADSHNCKKNYAAMERRLCGKINRLKIMGNHTAASVNIEAGDINGSEFYCHINIGCRATRYAEIVL